MLALNDTRASNGAASALVVDDHGDMARMVASALAADGWNTRVAVSGREALVAISADAPDLVVTDLRMPEVDGFAVLEAAGARTAVIVMTAFGDIAAAVEAMRRGATHFVEKPVRMASLVEHARRVRDSRARGATAFGTLVGTSPAMRRLTADGIRIARSNAAVLIRGESGTGKELVARAIHDASGRAGRAFVAINCAAVPESLVESELFGHTRGAFTGAGSDRNGVFAEADRGTLFLDEIGDMPLATQAKLLRVLQDGEVRPVGAEATRKIDVRVIAATHQNLDAHVQTGRFRSDLYYRLAVVPIGVPSLRDRKEDIPLLARHFLARARERDPDCRVRRLADDAMAVLSGYPWPGNVRELVHVVERVAILGAREELQAEELRDLVPELAGAPGRFPMVRDQMVTLRELEDEYIAWVMERCGSNKARAAEVLGVDPSTLYRRARARAA